MSKYPKTPKHTFKRPWNGQKQNFEKLLTEFFLYRLKNHIFKTLGSYTNNYVGEKNYKIFKKSSKNGPQIVKNDNVHNFFLLFLCHIEPTCQNLLKIRKNHTLVIWRHLTGLPICRTFFYFSQMCNILGNKLVKKFRPEKKNVFQKLKSYNVI